MSMHTKNFNMDSFKKPEPNNFKFTDFRRDLHNRHKREVHMRKERLRAVETRFLAKQMITVDTSRARSNCDVVRMCIKELGMKEVHVMFYYISHHHFLNINVHLQKKKMKLNPMNHVIIRTSP